MVSVEEPLADTDGVLVVVGSTVVLPGPVTDDCAILISKVRTNGNEILT